VALNPNAEFSINELTCNLLESQQLTNAELRLRVGERGEHDIWVSDCGVCRDLLLPLLPGVQRGDERPVALAEARRAAPGGVHGVLLVQRERVRGRGDSEPLLHVPPHLGSQENVSQSLG